MINPARDLKNVQVRKVDGNLVVSLIVHFWPHWLPSVVEIASSVSPENLVFRPSRSFTNYEDYDIFSDSSPIEPRVFSCCTFLVRFLVRCEVLLPHFMPRIFADPLAPMHLRSRSRSRSRSRCTIILMLIIVINHKQCCTNEHLSDGAAHFFPYHYHVIVI